MIHSLSHVIHHANGQYGRQILSPPIFFARSVSTNHRTSALTASQLDAFFSVGFCQTRQHVSGDGLMHQQRLHCVAHTVAMGLGIQGDIESLVLIRLVIDIDVTNTVEVFDHGDASVFADTLNQPFAATRYNDIHKLGHGNQLTDGIAIGGFNNLYRCFRQARRRHTLADAFGNRLIGAKCLAAAAQNCGVTRFQAQACCINRHIRAGLINNADDPERYAHLAHLNTTWTITHIGNFTTGIRQGGHLAQTFNHAINTL